MLRSELDAWFCDHLAAEPEQLLALLDAPTVTCWPTTPPPVLYHAGRDIVVDLDAATRHLVALCTIAPEGQGPLVNIRAEHFEQTVQDLIDRSPHHSRNKPGRDSHAQRLTRSRETRAT